MSEQEKKVILEEERTFYIECETILRSFAGKPSLEEFEIESHMKLCKLYLDKFLSCYNSIYHPESPFALRFKEDHNHEAYNRIG